MTARTRGTATVTSSSSSGIAAAAGASKTKTKKSSSASPPHPPPPPPAVAFAGGHDDDDDDDAPEEMKSKVVRDDDQEQESKTATASSKSKSKKLPRKVKAREERYWAEKEGQGEGGEGVEEEETKEGEEGAAAAAAEGEGEAQEKAAGRVSKKTKVSSSAVAGPLSANFLESVQRAKQAEQQRRIHEALQVIESARHKAEAAERRKPKAVKAPRVIGNIRVATLGALQQQTDEVPDVPSEVLAFARTLGESTGKATQRKRVPFVAFAKGKPKVPATAAVRRVSGGKGKLSSSRK